MPEDNFALTVYKFLKSDLEIQQPQVCRVTNASRDILTSYRKKNLVACVEKTKHNRLFYTPRGFLEAAIIYELSAATCGPVNASKIAEHILDKFHVPVYPSQNSEGMADISALPEFSTNTVLVISSLKDHPAIAPNFAVSSNGTYHWWLSEICAQPDQSHKYPYTLANFNIGRAFKYWIDGLHESGGLDA